MKRANFTLIKNFAATQTSANQAALLKMFLVIFYYGNVDADIYLILAYPIYDRRTATARSSIPSYGAR